MVGVERVVQGLRVLRLVRGVRFGLGQVGLVVDVDRTARVHGDDLHAAEEPVLVLPEPVRAEGVERTGLAVLRLAVLTAGADGCVVVPTAPGLGVDLDEDVLESLRIDG